VWVFQDGNLSGLLGFTATGTLDTSIPILMFCLAFGVSMDYEVFLLSRIKEEYDRTGDNAAAVAMGLARTGKIVTTAAVLLATVLVIFATSGVTLIKLFGVGLALALVMDATLIRMCLVPAVMKLAGQANWWLPLPLRRFHQSFKISELETKYTVEATRDFTSHREPQLQAGKYVDVCDFVVEHLSSPDAVAVLNETGHVVYCTYASPRGHAHLGYRRYLPKNCAGEDVVFQTKPQLTVDLLNELDTSGVLPPWVASDEKYGRDTKLRSFCEDRAVGYVLGVPSSFTVTLNSHRKARANQALKLVQATAWNRVSCGPWSTGERTYAWAWIATTSPQHSLLVRRNLTDPTDRAYFYCYVPEGRTVTLGTLVRVAGMRWPVEEDFQVDVEEDLQVDKDFQVETDQSGLDHSPVRLQPAQTRHLVLTMAALAIGALTAAAMREATYTSSMIRSRSAAAVRGLIIRR
ncbi:MAG: MMPL family transporter, partial [Pseudonocardiales bacterium]